MPPFQGSEFVVRLPLAATETGELPGSDICPAESPAAAPNRSELRILLVEDSAAAREMLHSLLELDGYHVAAAADAQAALDLLDFQPFDLALVDIGLPDMDGCELARIIRARPEFDGLFLAALTGYGQKEDHRRALEAGFDVLLVKPLDLAAFTQMVGQRFGADGRPCNAQVTEQERLRRANPG